MKTANEIISFLKSWEGKKESDNSYLEIINIYNSAKPLPRNYKLKKTDNWCAATISAAAIKLGYTDIIPIECSCGKMVEKAQKMGIWQENDAYFPNPGDLILYDWQDNGKGDNKGWPDHIGMVISVNDGKISVIEGNYQDSVKVRTIPVNGKYIRGYITPHYDADTNIQNAEVTDKLVKTEAAKVETFKTGVVNAKRGLNVRSSAIKTSTNKLYAIAYGTTVTIFGEQNGWLHVHVKNRADGWVAKEYITER